MLGEPGGGTTRVALTVLVVALDAVPRLEQASINQRTIRLYSPLLPCQFILRMDWPIQLWVNNRVVRDGFGQDRFWYFRGKNLPYYAEE